MKRAHTCLEVGDDGATGEGSFGGVKGHGVAGAGLQVGQLVLLLGALHQESICCHWKAGVKLLMHVLTAFTSSYINR